MHTRSGNLLTCLHYSYFLHYYSVRLRLCIKWFATMCHVVWDVNQTPFHSRASVKPKYTSYNGFGIVMIWHEPHTRTYRASTTSHRKNPSFALARPTPPTKWFDIIRRTFHKMLCHTSHKSCQVKWEFLIIYCIGLLCYRVIQTRWRSTKKYGTKI